MSTNTERGRLRELTDEECWDHLAARRVGRIGYVERNRVVILPLNYLAQDGLIWVRTASYNQLAVHLPGQQAAFEIDEIDERTHTGWSVLVRGRVDHVTGDEHPARLGSAEGSPWPEGTRSMVFCLTPDEVTGRALIQGDVTPDPTHGPGSIQRS